MTSVARSYGGVTAEQRRTTRRAALLEAALDLFAEDGARAVSKRAVCSRARLNDRYFYEHFADSDALLEAVVRDQTTAGLEAVGTAARDVGSDVGAQIRATAAASLEFLTADPRRGQLLLRSHTSDVMQRARVDSTRAIANAMTGLLADRVTAESTSRLDTEMASFALVSGAMEVIAGWLRGDFATDQDHVADTVAGLLLAIADIADIAAALPAVSASGASGRG